MGVQERGFHHAHLLEERRPVDVKVAAREVSNLRPRRSCGHSGREGARRLKVVLGQAHEQRHRQPFCGSFLVSRKREEEPGRERIPPTGCFAAKGFKRRQSIRLGEDGHLPGGRDNRNKMG